MIYNGIQVSIYLKSYSTMGEINKFPEMVEYNGVRIEEQGPIK